MKSKTASRMLTVAGLALLAVGLILLKQMAAPQGALRVLPYVCVGIGCGAFGHGMGELVSRRSLRRHPEAARQAQIDRADERNVAIACRAKAKAYDLMLPIFGALMVAFALMGVDLAVVLLLVAAYLLVCGCCVYYRARYEREM